MRRWIVTFLGTGLIPGAPGTWATLMTAVFLYAIYRIEWSATGWNAVLGGGVVVFGALTAALGPWAINHFGRKDPGAFVLDECAGLCVTMIALPLEAGWKAFAIAVVAFRVFDVLKPPPVRQLERLPAGWGILMDDVAAGGYANLVCQVVLRVIR